MGIAFTIGSLSIYWYSIMIAIGGILSLSLVFYRFKQKELSIFHFWMITIFGCVFMILASRWWYLAFNPRDYRGIQSLFAFGNGRSILGAIFILYIWLWIYSKWIYPELDYRLMISIYLPNLLLAQAIGRWGNFFNQEVYGLAVSQLDWLPSWISNQMFIDNSYREPLFLYEMLTNLLGWWLLAFVVFNSNKFKDGTAGSLYLVWYGISRAAMEPFRDQIFIMKTGGLYSSLILSIIFVVIGLMMFIYYQFYYDKAIDFWEFKLNIYKKNINKNIVLISKLATHRISWSIYKNIRKIHY